MTEPNIKVNKVADILVTTQEQTSITTTFEENMNVCPLLTMVTILIFQNRSHVHHSSTGSIG